MQESTKRGKDLLAALRVAIFTEFEWEISSLQKSPDRDEYNRPLAK